MLQIKNTYGIITIYYTYKVNSKCSTVSGLAQPLKLLQLGILR